MARSGGSRADARREAVARAVERCSRPSLWSPRRVAVLGSWLEDKTRGEGRANVGPSEESPSRAALTSRVSRRHQWRNRPSHLGSSRLFSRQVRTEKNRRFTTRRMCWLGSSAGATCQIQISRLSDSRRCSPHATALARGRHVGAPGRLPRGRGDRRRGRGRGSHARVSLRWWFSRSEPPSFQQRDPRGQDAEVPRAAWRGRRRRAHRGGRRRLGRGVPLVLPRGGERIRRGRGRTRRERGRSRVRRGARSCSPARRPPRSPSPSRARSPRAATAPAMTSTTSPTPRTPVRGRRRRAPSPPATQRPASPTFAPRPDPPEPPAPGRASTPSLANFACSWRNPPCSPLSTPPSTSAT